MTLPNPLPTADAPTLTEFLLARIAEDEAEVDHPLFEGSTARVLAECEAKRRIVMRHAVVAGECLGCGVAGADIDPLGLGVLTMHCPENRYLAAIYSGHPAYRAEWKP